MTFSEDRKKGGHDEEIECGDYLTVILQKGELARW